MTRTLAALALFLVLAGCGGGGEPESSGPQSSPLEEAAQTCQDGLRSFVEGFGEDAPAVEDVVYMDSGSLLISTPEPRGEIAAGMAFTAAECATSELDAPGSVIQRMGATTAMSGPGEADWHNYRAAWSYNGSDSVFEASIDEVS